MHYIIYIDVYFLVNFLMNGLLLRLLDWSIGNGTDYIEKKKAVKMAGGAFLGSILTCFSMLVITKWRFVICPVLIHGLIGWSMIRITFAVRGIKNQLKLLLRLSLLQILAGGILNLLFFRSTYGKTSYDDYGLGVLPMVAAGLGVAILLREVLKDNKREKRILCHLYGVKFYHRGKEIEGTAFLDTGNHLREPFTGKAVVVIEKELAKKLLGQREILSIMAYANGKTDYIPVNPVKLIPFHSLGEQHGVMPGVLIDKMVVQKEQEERIYEKVQIGIMEEILSGEELYQVILHEEYVR